MEKKPHIFHLVKVLFLLIFVSIPAMPQSVSLHNDELEKAFQNSGFNIPYLNQNILIVNGNRHFYRAKAENLKGKPIPLGRVSTLLWNFAAMRLIDMGGIKTEDPVLSILTDLDLDSPFREILTIRHLLAGTGGFASPPWYSSTLGYKGPSTMNKDLDWQEHLIPISNPGLTGRYDITGEALLARLIMTAWGKNEVETLNDLIFIPLGLSDKSLIYPDRDERTLDDFFSPVLEMSLTEKGLIALLEVLTTNRLSSGEKFLSLRNYEALIKGQGWRIHPLAPGRTYGMFAGEMKGRRTAQITSVNLGDNGTHLKNNAGLVLLPGAGIAIMQVGGIKESYVPWELLTRVSALIAEEYTPASNYFRERKAISDSTEARERSGFFMLDNEASSWLGEKINRMKNHSLFIDISADAVRVKRNQVTKIYHRVEPRVYKAQDGEKLFVSPLSGGHINIAGNLYRYTGPMGSYGLMFEPVPYAIILILTIAVYWRSRRGADWRRFSRWGIAGVSLFSLGLWLELSLYPSMWIDEQKTWAVLLWRSAFNIGLMLLLTLPLYAWRFGKRIEFQKTVRLTILGLHIIVIAGSAIVLALLAIAWGLAGEFRP